MADHTAGVVGGEAPLDPLSALEQALNSGDFQRAVQAEQFGDALGQAVGTLRERAESLATLEQLVGWVSLVAKKLTPAEVVEVRTALDALEATAGNLSRGNPTREELQLIRLEMQTVSMHVEQVKGRLRAAWSFRVREEFEPSAKLAKALQRLPGQAQLAQRMAQTAQAGLALEQRFPAQTAREEFERRRAERQAQERELVGVGTDADRVRFLIRVTDGRATLADLTPDLQKWLAEQNALGLFKLKLE
jgi:HAMP domain-containing protein